MKPMLGWGVILFICGFLACAHNDTVPEREEEAVQEEPRAVVPETPPDDDADAEGRTPFEDVSEEELQQALDRAIDAAVNAEGRSPCDKSYNAMVAMRDSLVADLGEAAAQDLPPRQRFIAACEELPADAQKCMDVSYAMSNPERCRQVMEAVPPERRRALEEVLQGR